MIRQQKNYTREFKLEAVNLWQTTDKSAREIAEDLGISRGTLYRWKR